MKRATWFSFGSLAAVLLAMSIGIEARAWPRGPQSAPETAASHHAAGMEHLQAGRAEQALAEFGAAVRLDHNYLPSLLAIADLLSSSGQVFQAYGVLEHAVSIAPESADVHALLGRCLSRLEKLPEARQEFRHTLELNPSLSEPYLGLATIELRQGRFAEARQHIETFLERGEASATAKELLAGICVEMKDYDAALATYAEVQKMDPKREDIRKQIALTFEAAGRYAEAEQAFRSVLERNPSDREALRGLFDSSYNRGAYVQAIQATEQLAKREPRSCAPLLDMARAYRRLNKLSQARESARRCLELEPDHGGAHLLIGWTWFSEGELAKAKAELEKAVRSDPNSVEALYWLGMAETRRGEKLAALDHLEKAVAADLEFTSARYALAQAYSAQLRLTDAKKQFEEFRRLKGRETWKSPASGESMPRPVPSGPVDVSHLEDWIGFANYLLTENKPRDALLILREARQIAPENTEMLLLEAGAYTETGEIDTALAAYAEAEKHGPTAPLFLSRGTLHRRLGENEPALADLRRALTMHLPAPKAAQAHLLIASILNERKRPGEAERELRLALARDPNNSGARLELASTLLALTKPAEAAAECNAILLENSADSSARLLLARALLDQKRLGDAGDQITRAAQIEGESGRILLERGRLAAAEGRTELAIDYLERAGRMDPSQAQAFYLLGKQFLVNRRVSEAAVAFEKATIVDPLHAESWLELGKIYLGAGRVPAAVGYFRKAVSAAPESAEAQYQLALALARNNQLDEAEQAARRAKALGSATAEELLQSLARRTPR